MAASEAIAEAMRALGPDPARAEQIARTLLAAEPDQRDARLILSEALRRQGKLTEARSEAEADVTARPESFAAQRHLGVVLAQLGEHAKSAAAFQRAAKITSAHPHVWRELGDQRAAAGDAIGARAAYASHIEAGGDPRLARAADALARNDVAAAHAILDPFLAEYPTDVIALRLLSEAHARADRPDLAEASLRRALDLAPDFDLARHNLGQLLLGLGRYAEARDEAETLLKRDPNNRGSLRLLASALSNIGEYDRAIAIYQSLLSVDPNLPRTWLALGHMLKTVGRTEGGIAAYRKAIELTPGAGEAYWSLANLKTMRFSADEIAAMEAQLARPDLSSEDRVNMLYALGRAHEDAERPADAFQRYSEGAALHRATYPYDADLFSKFVASSKSTFTPSFFAERFGQGEQAPDAIFIVGLPRAGSTLVEQILASHSQVEATMELLDLGFLARSLIDPERSNESYLPKLASLDASDLKRLGQRYLETTRIHRRTKRPLFINKMPNDFAHTGLISLILPNAKIIDARRHPLACGWSCFKQHFAMGQNFSYDLADIGRYYADYVGLMAHFDAVLPGRVHRVIHEELVADPEPYIRALLDCCGLPFEAACLSPHETERAVRTASSEQVRKPISDRGLNDWKPFEPYLDPLKAALGATLASYPRAP